MRRVVVLWVLERMSGCFVDEEVALKIEVVVNCVILV